LGAVPIVAGQHRLDGDRRGFRAALASRFHVAWMNDAPTISNSDENAMNPHFLGTR
jgi:hypothetical protein